MGNEDDLKKGGREVNTDIQQQRVENAAEIFKEYGNYIFAMIRFQVRDESTANDIFQDFFISLIRKPIPQRVKNIKAYLYRAIRNDVLDTFRKENYYKDRMFFYQEARKREIAEEDPRSIIARADEIQKAIRFVENNLPPHESRVVISKYYHGRNNEETANKLSIDKKTVSRYFCMGLKRIHKIIGNNNRGS